jgi:hypothetical protein
MFLTKLSDMLGDESLLAVVRWDTGGASFSILDLQSFAQDVLPQHFKHGNVQSFLRQLNAYG